VAVTRDPRNSARIRITCRDESERARVREVAEKTKALGSRVLRDQWCPIKVDNAYRTAVLDENDEVRAGVTEMLEKENCHGQNVTAPDGCLRHTDQLGR
jgi:hypothetical protein